MEEKFIMILGAGLMQRPSIEAAKELGFRTLVIDANPNAVCVPYADRFEPVDLKDREAIAELALSLGDSLAGIFTAGTDFSASVSYAAQKCGLVSHDFEAALNASNKIRMRQCFKKHGVPSPDFFSADESYLRSLEEGKCQKLDFPKVVKPCDNMGARGCRLVRNEKEFIPALRDAISFSRTRTAIVEDYMEGSEFSIDALVCHGKVIITGFADRHIYFEPYFIELGHTMPSEVSEEVKAALVKTFTDGVHALGLTNGVAKGDIKYTSRGPMIGEIAGRLSGGYMSGWTFPYSSGVFLTKEAMKISAGLECSYALVEEIPSVNVSHERAFISIPGRIKKIYGTDGAVASPFVKNVFMRVSEGSEVDFPRNNVEKCGNVISCCSDRGLSLWGAESAVASIVLRLEPNNKKTDSFLNFEELPFEEGFPYCAFNLQKDEFNSLMAHAEELKVFKRGMKLSDCIPDFLRKNELKDFNYRTFVQTAKTYDELCPDHGDLDAGKFFSALVRGGIQGILYLTDCAEEKCGE
ncbi:MAG: ATP-grasp domain-containing protein [Treponema sp.]|nr:ATP-grasp domain-containing protein [Treponema sp.]